MIYKEIVLPDDLKSESEKFIKNIIDELDETGQLSKRDTGCYYILAESYDTYLEALEIQKEEGLISESKLGTKSIHPAVKLAKEMKITILRTMLEMGLSLRSRKTLKVLENNAEESPLAEFLRQNKND